MGPATQELPRAALPISVAVARWQFWGSARPQKCGLAGFQKQEEVWRRDKLYDSSFFALLFPPFLPQALKLNRKAACYHTMFRGQSGSERLP